jgi:hypothetical protein
MVRTAGAAMLRADLALLFAGIAVLCGAAARTQSRTWIVAAVTMLTAIVAGRMLGWVSGGEIGRDVAESSIELGLIATLIAFGACHRTRSASTSSPIKAAAPCQSPRRSVLTSSGR